MSPGYVKHLLCTAVELLPRNVNDAKQFSFRVNVYRTVAVVPPNSVYAVETEKLRYGLCHSRRNHWLIC